MKKTESKISIIVLDFIINIAIILGLVIVIQKWIIAPFDVHGQSMCDTFNIIDGECHTGVGEKIIINEALYLFNTPERGDVVVFSTKDSDDKFYIKRVIGLPGETVEIKKGEVYITDAEGELTQLNEGYLNSDNQGNTKSYYSQNSIFEVPENHYFLLGDNRKASTDSRTCFGSNFSSGQSCKQSPIEAFVERSYIRGKVAVVWWPLANIRLMEDYEYSNIDNGNEDQENSESLEEK